MMSNTYHPSLAQPCPPCNHSCPPPSPSPALFAPARSLKTPAFVKELWELLISAANSGFGLPQPWLDAKKEELRLKKEEADRIAAELRKKVRTVFPH